MARRSVTSHDVARVAGVSRATVSLVLNQVPGATISEPTRQRVLEAARELDYHINAVGRSLRRQRTGVIGLIVRQPPGGLSADAFLPPIIEGITSVGGPAGLRLLIEPLGPTRPLTYVSLVREGHVDGLIFAAAARTAVKHLIGLHDDGVPIVLWGQLPDSNLPFVDVDNTAAARTAVEHLIGLGHRRIACITNAHPGRAVKEASDRLRGYHVALEAHGLSVDEGLVRYGNYDERSGFEAMQSLLECPEPPSAVFVASDEVALGALQAARAAGIRVPQDLAVAGFDDIPISRLVVPALTTVRVPAREIGATAARMLVELVESGRRPESVLLETELVVRESSGAPRAATTARASRRTR
jgi:DNA-binding LacI/PurR family transcriptional regulator